MAQLRPRRKSEGAFASKHVHFSNAFLRKADDEPVVLALPHQADQCRSARDVRRAIERWQTKTFIQKAIRETRVSSAYALEEKMMIGEVERAFPDDRPKLCDRMESRGGPAVVKLLSTNGRNDAETMGWFKRILALAPGSARVLSLPIWRLLDPKPLPYVEWHTLGTTHAKLAWDAGLRGAGAWLVRVTPSDSEMHQEHYVPVVGEAPCQLELAALLLGLRRWESQGDLVGYSLFLQEALRVARSSTPERSLAVLQPDIGDYIAQVFGRVQVPYGKANRQAQEQRVAAARTAWEQRVVVGRTEFDR